MPLCAPALAAGLPALPDSERLDTAPLLHDETLNDWQSWFAGDGSTRSEFSLGLNFSVIAHMLQAAELGLGICLATPRQAEQSLRDGRLTQASKTALDRSEPLYMSCWTRNFGRPSVTRLRDWLLIQCPPQITD